MSMMKGSRTFAALTLVISVLAAGAGAQTPTPAVPANARALSLTDAISLAEQQSEEVEAAGAAVLRSRGEVLRARSQYFPQLYGSVQYQRTLQSQFQEITEYYAEPGGGTGGGDLADSPIARIFASEQQIVLGLQLEQNLFTGGRIRAQYDAARAGREAAEVGLASAQAKLRLDVAQAYLDAVLADRLADIAESTLVQTQATLRQTRLARQVGNTSEFELLRAQVTQENQVPVTIQARTQRDVALLRLRQLLELPLDEPLILTTAIDDVDAALPDLRLVSQRSEPTTPVDGAAFTPADTAVDARATVRQAREALDVNQSLLRASRAQRWPTLTVSSQYGRTGYPEGGIPPWVEFFPNWTVSVGLQMPLFTGGRVRGEQMIAEAGVHEARAQYEQTRELAALDARLALAQLEEAQAAWLASRGTAEQASRAYTIAEVRYREGLSTQLELTQSRILLEQAQANRATAARDLQLARLRLALLKDLPLEAGQNPSARAPAARSAGQQSPPSAGPQGQGTGGFTQTSSFGSTPQ